MADRGSAAMSKPPGAPDPLLGRIINERFKIASLIARGGMGKVYRAEQAPLGRMCALKVLNPNYAGEHDPEFSKRFFLEASTASKLTHPNTVTIFDYGRTEDDVYYMAMEYLEGQTLHRAIREVGFFSEERTAHIARQMCRALREAHSLGVIHRDLKPANIFLVQHGDESDFVKVLDFGLVKDVSGTKTEELTQTGLFMGSPKYMAPEQIRGDRVDARTDIYALGIILYEMLSGKVPFDRPNSVNILMAHVHEDAPPIRTVNPRVQLSVELEQTVQRCMAKDPDQRFRSMDEVLAALKRVGGTGMLGTGAQITGEYRAHSFSGQYSGPGTIPASIIDSGFGQGPSLPPPNPSGVGSFSSGPLMSPQMASVIASPPRSMKNGPRAVFMGAVAGGGLVVIAAMAALALRTPSRATSPLVPPPPPAVAPPPTVSVPQPPLPLFVKVRLNTDPDGASVKEDGVEICTSTPCDVVYRGAEADPSQEHKLLFSKLGFKVESRVVSVADSPVMVKLTRAPAAWTSAPPAKPDTPAPAPAN